MSRPTICEWSICPHCNTKRWGLYKVPLGDTAYTLICGRCVIRLCYAAWIQPDESRAGIEEPESRKPEIAA